MDAATHSLSGQLVGISTAIQRNGLQVRGEVHDEHKIALTIGAHLRRDPIRQVTRQRTAKAQAVRQLAIKIRNTRHI